MHLKQAIHDVLDFCYPGACASCAEPTACGAALCGECSEQLDALAAARGCERCGMPLATAGGPCPYCMGRGVTPFDRIVRLAVFDDPVKHLVHQIKYHKRWPLAELLTDRLLETERAKGLLTETQVLVPVPLHIRRHIARGYNQADVIAHRIRRICRLPVINAVRRIKNTETQTHMTSHAKRVDNVRGAFSLRRRAAALEGKHVVLIDDVMTTGSTLQAVGRMLKLAKPASICAMVLAIADPKHRGFEVI